MKVLSYRSLLILVFIVVFKNFAGAQWTQDILDFNTDRFPIIDVQVAVRQNKALIRSLDSTQFRLWEDGYEQGPLSLVFEDAQHGFSFAIVIPLTSTMTSGDIAVAKGLGSRLVDRMDGLLDECCIFDGNVMARQDLTHIKPFLNTALDGLQTGGPDVSILDGTYAAINQVAQGANSDRAVVLISNGRGGPGTRTLNDIIAIANTAQVKIYCFGVNAVGSDDEMKVISEQTGGIYYSNADVLVQEVIDILSGRPEYGILSYTSNNHCRDGVARDLSVRFRQQNDSVTTAEQLPLSADSATDITMHLAVDTTSITSGVSREVSLKMESDIRNQLIYSGTIELSFDTALLSLNNVITSGTITASMNATVAPTENGATITLTGTAKPAGKGDLLFLVFSAGDVPVNTDVEVNITDVQFERGCITTQHGPGRITIRPKNAALSVTSSPVVFSWDGTTGQYTPDPAVVAIEVRNTGDIPVTNLSAVLDKSRDVRIAYGAAHEVKVNPDSLGPGQTGTAIFTLQALPVPTERTERVIVTVTSEQVSEGATLFFNLRAAESAVRSFIHVDEVTLQGGSYTPDPASITATVRSAGTAGSPGGTVTLILPTELTVSSSETQSFTGMQPNDSTVFVWQLQYPQNGNAASYSIAVITAPSSQRPDTSYVVFSVPERQTSQFSINCTITPQAMQWSPAAGEFDPLETEYSLTVENTGSVDISSIQAQIVIPNALQLAPGETTTTTITDLNVAQQKTVTWKLLAIPACADADVEIEASVTGQSGVPQICTTPLFIQSANSAKPIVENSSPTQLDTLNRGEIVTFVIDASDPDQQELLYLWGVNGDFESVGSESTYSKEFAENGEFEVVCHILDPCAIAGEGDTTTVVWSFTVRSPLFASGVSAANDVAILGNYPNPFNPGTIIVYSLRQGRHPVSLDVIDAFGRVVKTLLNEIQDGGLHQLYLDAQGMTSGVYLLRLQSGNSIHLHQLTLVK